MTLTVKWPYPPVNNSSKIWAVKSKIIIAIVGTLSKVWAEWVNKVTVHNKETLYRAVEERPPNKPLVTVCNHYSCFDEPMLWGVLKWSHLVTNNEVMRWTLAAADVCFTKEWHSKVCALGQVVPVIRGHGVYQKSMDFMVEKLNSGHWVHMFPEGKINMDKELLRLKWGIGRLISECNVQPIVIPFWHIGMDSVLPNYPPWIPRMGKKVTVVFGKPIDFTDLLHKHKEANSSRRQIRKSVTDVVEQEFKKLKEIAESIHPETGES